MHVSASHARQNFAALLDRAIAGEEILIERHGRQVARLLPAAPLELAGVPARHAKVAEVRGVDANAPLSRVFRDRALKRLQIAQPRAESCIARLAERGVKARIIGSLALGKFRQTSDVDILVEDPGALKESQIERIVRTAMRDFPFDVIYARKIPLRLRKHLAP